MAILCGKKIKGLLVYWPYICHNIGFYEAKFLDSNSYRNRWEPILEYLLLESKFD